MQTFSFIEAETPEQALDAAHAHATFFAGGTTLIDLMKLDVLAPAALVDINRLPFTSIETTADALLIGANVRNSDLAHHPFVRERFPVISEALLSGASAQLRNMASTAGNLMQRTRCTYFRDVNSRCNKRQPGSGCDALTGFNRSHAVLGTSDHCIATHPSDLCVALIALDAVVHTRHPDGSGRTIPLTEFYLLPGETPERETVLRPGELITHVQVPESPVAAHSHYLKVRDRASYEFALASAAVALHLNGKAIAEARVGLGGIATIPWRSREAERVLVGKPAVRETFAAAANAALAGARPQQHNAFKIPLAKQTLILALEDLTARNSQA
jgi:xanthine dehydrogenase YagS FAD-binding subunit